MRFGKTLRESTYPPWKDQYIDYSKLKTMLRVDIKEEEDTPWTVEDENRFCDEIFNVQLEKVAQFQRKTALSLQERAEAAFQKLKEVAPNNSNDGDGGDEDTDNTKGGDGRDQIQSDVAVARLKGLKGELDSITNELRELKRYCSINYTGFLKIVKKHDRKRGDLYKVRPMMRVSLSEQGFNSEQEYSPLIKKLSLMYYIVNARLDEGEQHQQPLDLDLEHHEEARHGERYTAHKFWVHPDNLLEVKTAILRHLPAVLYKQQDARELDGSEDLATTSLYFDNKRFELYSRKVDHQVDTSSLRLRWYGQLSSKPDIVLEQKIIHENGSSEERRFTIKDKYIKRFIDGEYKMEKSIQKMERQGQTPEAIDSFRTTVEEIQNFIQSRKLEPVLRANYTRTAFQKPDDHVRILIDTDIAFVREDTLDRDRPCRDPKEWHRRDIDGSNMTYPFEHMNQSEVSRFPYALLEIKLREDSSRKRPRWIEDLMASHLLYAAPRFSKFVHGVASLFDDFVNNLPFWLSDMETDIRKDPHKAHDQEEQRKAQRAEDAQVVGSFLGTGAKIGSYKPVTSSPVGKSYLSERAAEEASASASRAANAERDAEQEDAREEEADVVAQQQRGYGAISSVLPGFSLARYSRARRRRQQQQLARLPEGVREPETWIKNAGPLQIEPKVWLANERTFLKWQHICVLLGSLAVSLYTAAGENNFLAECMGITYVAIAAAAGAWGYYMLHVRRDMIRERSGRDFDNAVGPLVVSVALMLALISNFVFAYREAFSKLDNNQVLNVTAAAFVGGLFRRRSDAQGNGKLQKELPRRASLREDAFPPRPKPVDAEPVRSSRRRPRRPEPRGSKGKEREEPNGNVYEQGPLTEWPPSGVSSEEELPLDHAVELIARGVPLFKGHKRPVPHASDDYYGLYTTTAGNHGDEDDAAKLHDAMAQLMTVRIQGSSTPVYPWETLEQPSFATGFGRRPGTISLNRWVGYSSALPASIPLRDPDVARRVVDLAQIFDRLKDLEAGLQEDDGEHMYRLYKWFLKDRDRLMSPHRSMEKQITDLVMALSSADWIDFTSPRNQVVTKFIYDTSEANHEQYLKFFYQLLLSLELELRINSNLHDAWAKERLMSQIPPRIQWNLALARRWRHNVRVEYWGSTADQVRLRFKLRKRQTKVLKRFAQMMKWPNLDATLDALKKRDAQGTSATVSSHAMAFFSGLVLPGPTFPFLIMNALIDIDPDKATDDLALLTHLHPNCGFQYKNSYTYWTSTCIVGKVLAPTCLEVAGWVGPALPTLSLKGSQIARIRARRPRQRITLEDVTSMSERSDPLGPPAELYPVKEYTLLTPPDADYEYLTADASVRIEQVNLHALPDHHSGRSPPPPTPGTHAGGTRVFDASVQFAIDGASWPLNLNYDVSFVSAWPCSDGPHPLFFDYVYTTVTADEVVGVRDWGRPRRGGGFGSFVSDSTGFTPVGSSSRQPTAAQQQQQPPQKRDGADDEDDDDVERVLVIEAFGPPDNEVLARAWCAHWGLSAVAADLGKTCMACAIREAYAATLTVVILVDDQLNGEAR
ncbi:hypothetical protein DL766_003137 [Monosporascus sp. MC13-8B]|uniref:SPX domain-containing protein n=1 Tax=Monosporascus cannonballus TaxID=155416 RepID=A0ABY0HG95_9PEZI|nr:hypothetical protein DL763_010181 [Monosporascus cannonballus]RYO92769.1 hypothetical protein DL762_001475 [Monosporascus cannonballus]RYP34149.1 hypothetical protein DL766_003137 [Monosporascus sp. MC13-8B]